MNCLSNTDARRALMTSAALICVLPASPALAQTRTFDVPALPSGAGVATFARQAQIQLLISERDAHGRRTNAVKGGLSVEEGLRMLLQGTGLSYRQNGPQTYVVTAATVSSAPASSSGAPAQAAGGPGEPAPEPSQDIIVTAQKRAENIQNVPIAVSAFSAAQLDSQKIEGGSELLRAIPNVTFSKTNFASYNFSIRGIGTKALSVTTDPAVAVSFNNTPLLRNRLFEQEYFDVERVEVLRGPQGTLYGRNATAGVVNMISAKPVLDKFEGNLKTEIGNYDSRRVSAMLNIPIGDTIALRAAGAYTDRDGYDYNTVTGKRVNGRDLWSGRISARWQPSSRFHADLIWEHFNENDNRSRTGKQLCHTDPGPSSVDGVTPTAIDRNFMSQGCSDGSLYGAGAFGVVNGASLPQVLALSTIAGVINGTAVDPNQGTFITLGTDPFSGATQSHDLRTISTTYDPVFRAKNDVVQLNLQADVGDHLQFFSQTLYTQDNYYSSQDYARFQSNPMIFAPTLSGVYSDFSPGPPLTPGGIFTDPQLGPSDRFLAVDLSRSRSHQWSQEVRLQSSNSGPLNFSIGANYLKFKIDEDYFVFNNLFSLIAKNFFGNTAFNPMPGACAPGEVATGNPFDFGCVYVDPNPIGSINGDGHNYFRSRNLATTESKAAFGELYWQINPTLKFTGGLRFTIDTKDTTPVPSQLLLTPGFLGGGYVNSGYPAEPDIHQRWHALTGRAVIDWKPQLGFTDSSLLYASYSRGYKAGGTNSPGIGSDPSVLGFFPNDPRFRPEFVNAFEIGSKNTLAGGALTLNADAFFYDYKDYQVSEIIDRATLNENFSAKTWGAELEATWRATPRLRFNGSIGYLGSRIDNGQKSIDVMNRTQGNPDWVVIKPWVQDASNCIAPANLVAKVMQGIYSGLLPGVDNATNLLQHFCAYNPPVVGGAGFPADAYYYSQLLGVVYDPLTDAPNGGRGFDANLGGKELPNAPHLTFNIGAQYTVPIHDWRFTMRADYYRQSASWARVYNDPIDRIHAWGNANLVFTLEKPSDDLTFEFYIKNVFNSTPITDAFINSDDSGLTTNVFTLDPRIIAFSIKKSF